MKKSLAIFFATVMLLGCSGCSMETQVNGSSNSSTTSTTQRTTTTTTARPTTTTTKRTTTTTKKTTTTTKKKTTTTTKKKTTTTKKKTTTTTKKTTTTTRVSYSRLSGEFTYFYNNFIGTRGDNGAKVMLIPKDTKVKEYDNKAAMLFLTGKHDSGIIVEKCDGYGRFDTGIEYVPAGEYIVIVVSANTRNGASMSKETLSSRLGAYLSDENLETLALAISFYKCAIDTMTLKAGYEHTISHDFGTTYF